MSILDFLNFPSRVTSNKEDIKMKFLSFLGLQSLLSGDKRGKLSCDEITHFFEVPRKDTNNGHITEKIVLKFSGETFKRIPIVFGFYLKFIFGSEQWKLSSCQSNADESR